MVRLGRARPAPLRCGPRPGPWPALALLWLLAWLPVQAQVAPAGAQSAQVLRYGVLAGFPPYQVWPADAPPGGADVDLVREAARDAGVTLELVRYTDYRALEADLQAGRIGLASSMARTPAREAVLAFGPPYTQFQLALVTRADQPSGVLAPDLAGRSVAVVSGFASEVQADRLFPLASRVVVPGVREGLEAVRSGRADTFLESLPVVSEMMLRDRLTSLSIVRRFDAPAGRLHLAWPLAAPAQAALAAPVAAALAALPARLVEQRVVAWRAPGASAPGGPWALQADEAALLKAWPAPRIGVVGREPPFVSLQPGLGDGPLQAEGLSVDVLRAVLQRLGLAPAAFVPLTPREVAGAVADGRVDLVVGLDEAADLSAVLRFVGPFIEYPTVLIAKPDSGVFDLDQLHGRRLALTPGSAARALVDSRHPGIEVVDCADVQDCIETVAGGGAEATLADVVAAASNLARRPRADVQIIGSETQLRRAHSLAVAARHAALVPVIKRALDHTVATDMAALKTRWLTRPMRGEVLRAAAWRYGPWVGGVLLLALLAWAAHVRRLRAEVVRTRAAQQQAERAEAASRRLVTFLAHEVRNSLHGVIAATELVDLDSRRRGAAPMPSAAVQGALADSARATLRLLNNLIDRDRLDNGQLVLRTEAARLGELMAAVVAEIAPAATRHGLTLVLQPPSADPLLALDRLRVQQVLRNLLANAVKYAGRGRIELSAELQPAPPAEGEAARWQLRLCVADEGPGLAEVSGGRADSSGLGLPLCRDLARLMGGTLSLEERPGGGTLACLGFSAAAAPPVPARPAAVLRVLVVEDAEVYALLLERAFAQLGHAVRVAGTAAAARAALQAGAVDLLLIDRHLPDGTAADFLAELAAAPALAARVGGVVLMSADIDDITPAEARHAAGSAVLAKTGDAQQMARRALQAVAGA